MRATGTELLNKEPSHVRVVSTTSRAASPRQEVAISLQRLLWRRRAEGWDQHGSSGLTEVVEAVLESCQAHPELVAVDLGCGSGQVTLPLARRFAHVLAVDLNERAIELLRARAANEGIVNMHALVQPIETFDLGQESVDLVVSNYALHHLRDRDKAEVVRNAFEWLSPGGRLVVGDIMLGRGGSREDREVILSKVRALARRGPAGWWRILKNTWRFGLRFQEKPLPAGEWESLASQAGFEEVSIRRVVGEACVLRALKPGGNAPVRSTTGARRSTPAGE